MRMREPGNASGASVSKTSRLVRLKDSEDDPAWSEVLAHFSAPHRRCSLFDVLAPFEEVFLALGL